MKIIYSKSYDKTYKKLKNHNKELETLNNLIKDLSNIDKFKDLETNNYFKVHYNFEKLKHYDNAYSFNLNKNRGKIRLIAEKKEDDIIMIYISFDHYKDFNERKVIYYDKQKIK